MILLILNVLHLSLCDLLWVEKWFWRQDNFKTPVKKFDMPMEFWSSQVLIWPTYLLENISHCPSSHLINLFSYFQNDPVQIKELRQLPSFSPVFNIVLQPNIPTDLSARPNNRPISNSGKWALNFEEIKGEGSKMTVLCTYLWLNCLPSPRNSNIDTTAIRWPKVFVPNSIFLFLTNLALFFQTHWLSHPGWPHWTSKCPTIFKKYLLTLKRKYASSRKNNIQS